MDYLELIGVKQVCVLHSRSVLVAFLFGNVKQVWFKIIVVYNMQNFNAGIKY